MSPDIHSLYMYTQESPCAQPAYILQRLCPFFTVLKLGGSPFRIPGVVELPISVWFKNGPWPSSEYNLYSVSRVSSLCVPLQGGFCVAAGGMGLCGDGTRRGLGFLLIVCLLGSWSELPWACGAAGDRLGLSSWLLFTPAPEDACPHFSRCSGKQWPTSLLLRLLLGSIPPMEV